MTGRLITTTLFLFLGAAVNVGVAWGYTCFWLSNADFCSRTHLAHAVALNNRGLYTGESEHPRTFRRLSKQTDQTLARLRDELTAHELLLEPQPRALSIVEAPGYRNLFFGTTLIQFGGSDAIVQHEIHLQASGWPIHAVTSGTTVTSSSTRPTPGTSDDRIRRFGSIGHLPFSHMSYSQGLPIRPLWPGFAINTVLYAVLLWGLWQVPIHTRRHWRRRRDRCWKCAYPIAESETCSECGARVR